MSIFGTQDYNSFLKNLNEITILDLCIDILSVAGHKNIRITDGSGDGQRDIHSIDPDGEKYLTQSKYHKKINQTVSAKELGEVVLGMVRLGYKKGLFITNAKTSPQAKRDCLNDYPEYSVDYLEGREIVQKVFGDLILKAIWYDGHSLDKISYTILIPILARDLETDKPLPILPFHSEIMDGNEFNSGRSEIQVKFQRSQISKKVFKGYRSPKVKTLGEFSSSHINTTEAILSGVIHFEDIEDILSALENEIVRQIKNINQDKPDFVVLIGKPSIIPLGGKSSGARIELQDIESKTLVSHNNIVTSEVDWILPEKDSDWSLPKRASISQAEWIRWYSSTNDLCLDILVVCPPSEEIEWQFIEQRDFFIKWWGESLFVLVPNDLTMNWEQDNIAEPTKLYKWDDHFSLYLWIHPRLNSPIREFSIESEYEPLGSYFSESDLKIQSDLGQIKSYLELHGGVYIKPETARHMIAVVDHDPYPEIDIAEYHAKDLAYHTHPTSTPINPANRRFQFTVCWIVKTKSETTPINIEVLEDILDKLKTRKYNNIDVDFFLDTDTQSKYNFILAEIEVYPVDKHKDTTSALKDIEGLIVKNISDIEDFLKQFVEITRATKTYWDKEILMLF